MICPGPVVQIQNVFFFYFVCLLTTYLIPFISLIAVIFSALRIR